MPETMPFLSVDLTTQIMVVINFLVLYFVVKKLLFKPITKMINDRETEVKTMYENAQANFDASEAARLEYETSLRASREKAFEIVKNAEDKAKIIAEEMTAKAQAEAQEIVDKARRDAEVERKQIFSQMQNEISAISLAIASKILQKQLSEEDALAFSVEDFMEEVGK